MDETQLDPDLLCMRDIDIVALAEELEVTLPTIRRWVRNGLPCDPKPQRFDRNEVSQWLKSRRLTGKPGRPTQETSEQIKQAQLRVLLAKAEKHEMELARERGEWIPKAAFEEQTIKKILACKHGLLSLSATLPPRLFGQDQMGMAKIIDEEVHRLLTDFSENKY